MNHPRFESIEEVAQRDFDLAFLEMLLNKKIFAVEHRSQAEILYPKRMNLAGKTHRYLLRIPGQSLKVLVAHNEEEAIQQADAWLLTNDTTTLPENVLLSA